MIEQGIAGADPQTPSPTAGAASGGAAPTHSPLVVGCHLSVAKGFPTAARVASQVAANALQFFPRNPRGGAQRQVDEAERAEWLRQRDAVGLRFVIAHIPYTVNLASPKAQAYAFARRVLQEDLERCRWVGADAAVTHPGSYVEGDPADGIRRIVAAIEPVLPLLDEPGAPWLLLETMSGQGTEIGGRLEELRAILDGLGWPERVGVCLDTCHLFAAGYDWRDPAAVDRLVDDVDRAVGWGRVRALHVNDSKFPCGSRRDRHEKVGQGAIGREGFANLLRHPRLRALPMLLETPVDRELEYADEIRWLRELDRALGDS
ncbi:deoxyribonuclease IV [Thermaerobacter composti]|uniref:Probable endonuclease 4 n=1 Tax=Thermaerobacter composti TaxID=554949 RepID=A0ABZ0QR07_9FIRM|nr:deoxyribonuclease IV [Thermaerobacter composti]WPD18813.1 deoxyribonuclease IV [Thermaerobacter composti]